MGVVWEAWHTTLGIPVGVKILKDEWDPARYRRALERFRMEANFAAKINHPSIVRVLDFGDEGIPYLVMELVRGPDLHAWIRHRRRVDDILALKVVGHVAVGLAVLHQAGIVHRDLKPSNILISEGQALKLSDLGLARSPSDAVFTDMISGTPHYLAPESLDPARSADPRSDLYALGVMLFRMLIGRLPYTGTTEEVLQGHLRGQPDWTIPNGVRIDSGTLYLVMRLLEKDPTRRMQNAVEVVQACREQVARLETTRGLEASSDTQTESEDPATTAPAPRWRPLLRERLEQRRKGEMEKAHFVGKWAFWTAIGSLLVAGGFLVGRL
jgi:serine/threonine-protein kinase